MEWSFPNRSTTALSHCLAISSESGSNSRAQRSSSATMPADWPAPIETEHREDHRAKRQQRGAMTVAGEF